jgi:DNA-directed RNA polymerase subunit RPC12/RpoP
MVKKYFLILFRYVEQQKRQTNSTDRLKKGRQVAQTMAKDTEHMILYKCRRTLRTQRMPYNPTGDVISPFDGVSPMDPMEIRYKCLKCGHLAWVEAGSTGKSCHKCGYRIFMKPRTPGQHKILKAE